VTDKYHINTTAVYANMECTYDIHILSLNTKLLIGCIASEACRIGERISGKCHGYSDMNTIL